MKTYIGIDIAKLHLDIHRNHKVVNEPTSQPIALDVPTYLKNEVHESFSATNRLSCRRLSTLPASRRFHTMGRWWSGDLLPLSKAQDYLLLTEHASTMPASECLSRFTGLESSGACAGRIFGHDFGRHATF
jgi:hypothetical protein